MIGVADFINDPELLGRWFAGPSWENWLTVLKGAFGEPMTVAEQIRFRELAERDPPKNRCRELWCVVGRRGGKDSAASAIAAYAATVIDYRQHLRPGEKATVLLLAVDRDQARIIYSYIKSYFEQTAMLAAMVMKVGADTIELDNDCEITVATCNYRSVRGKTIALAILDEVAFWRDEAGAYASPDVEVYSALLPALTTLRRAGAMIVGISTAYRRSGLLFSKWREHHGRESDVLVIRAPSVTFNPTLDQAEIDADIALDPDRGEAEWLSEFRSDLADYVDKRVLDAITISGRHELPAVPGVRYVAFVDPSGGSANSFTAAVAHLDNSGVAILDAVREIRAPFSPEAATHEHVDFLKAYRVRSVVGDKYGGEWPSEQFEKRGIAYEASERTKSEIYTEVLPSFNGHKVELLDNRRLLAQLGGLERRVVRGTGRDVVDHGPGRHDDICNAACGALLLASADAAPMEITADVLKWAHGYRRDRSGQGFAMTPRRGSDAWRRQGSFGW